MSLLTESIAAFRALDESAVAKYLAPHFEKKARKAEKAAEPGLWSRIKAAAGGVADKWKHNQARKKQLAHAAKHGGHVEAPKPYKARKAQVDIAAGERAVKARAVANKWAAKAKARPKRRPLRVLHGGKSGGVGHFAFKKRSG